MKKIRSLVLVAAMMVAGMSVWAQGITPFDYAEKMREKTRELSSLTGSIDLVDVYAEEHNNYDMMFITGMVFRAMTSFYYEMKSYKKDLTESLSDEQENKIAQIDQLFIRASSVYSSAIHGYPHTEFIWCFGEIRDCLYDIKGIGLAFPTY